MMDKGTVKEIREIVDEVRDAATYGDTDAVFDGLDRIVMLIEENE